MNEVIIIDSETNSADKDCEYIEIAYIGLTPSTLLSSETPTNVEISFSQRYLPTKVIALGALATHHIHISDLQACPPTGTFELPKETKYIIGHNIDFDWRAIKTPDVRRVDTLALARYFLPDLDSHTQSALLYHILGVKARPILRDAHSAKADVRICLTILDHLIDYFIEVTTIEELWEVSEVARVPSHMQFGKHKGVAIANIPISYK